ncbi:hypothetical protein Barb7_01322 [Bacteroidales bacterium Barb7]|nr:hypothetical protein Barb7_02349 [Bacteroidales bacterium Barb7]OAV75107.1 hypothetical protein Barb7_01322 [Bacteroidales bacterium Barb7]
MITMQRIYILSSFQNTLGGIVFITLRAASLYVGLKSFALSGHLCNIS